MGLRPRTGLGKSDRPGLSGGLWKRGSWRELNGHVSGNADTAKLSPNIARATLLSRSVIGTSTVKCLCSRSSKDSINSKH